MAIINGRLIDRLSVAHWRHLINYGTDMDRQRAGHDACDAVLALTRQVEKLDMALKDALFDEYQRQTKADLLEDMAVTFGVIVNE